MAYNDLNSVLIEGETTAAPPQSCDDVHGVPAMSFTLSSHRQTLVPGTDNRRTETMPVTILIVGERMIDRYAGTEPGARLRVVGRLASHWYGCGLLRSRRTAIIAEHVEYPAVRLGSAEELATV